MNHEKISILLRESSPVSQDMEILCQDSILRENLLKALPIYLENSVVNAVRHDVIEYLESFGGLTILSSSEAESIISVIKAINLSINLSAHFYAGHISTQTEEYTLHGVYKLNGDNKGSVYRREEYHKCGLRQQVFMHVASVLFQPVPKIEGSSQILNLGDSMLDHAKAQLHRLWEESKYIRCWTEDTSYHEYSVSEECALSFMKINRLKFTNEISKLAYQILEMMCGLESGIEGEKLTRVIDPNMRRGVFKRIVVIHEEEKRVIKRLTYLKKVNPIESALQESVYMSPLAFLAH